MAQPVPVTDVKVLSRLYTGRRQVRRPAVSELRPIHALDTETYNGDIFLIADSDGRYLDKDITADSMLEFLFAKKYQNSWNFFYNLGYDAESILKLLGSGGLGVYARTRRTSFA
ncbi:MAG: DNA polymerase, partial [Nitrososphaera sp.]